MRWLMRDAYNNSRRLLVGRVLELPPQTRTVFACGRPYRVRVPYSIFSVALEKFGNKYSHVSSSVFWRNDPVQSLDDELHVTWFTNVSIAGHVCQPLARDATAVEVVVANAVERFWSSDFTAERTSNVNLEFWKGSLPDYYEAWSRWRGDFYTKKSPYPYKTVRDVGIHLVYKAFPEYELESLL